MLLLSSHRAWKILKSIFPGIKTSSEALTENKGYYFLTNFKEIQNDWTRPALHPGIKLEKQELQPDFCCHQEQKSGCGLTCLSTKTGKLEWLQESLFKSIKRNKGIKDINWGTIVPEEREKGVTITQTLIPGFSPQRVCKLSVQGGETETKQWSKAVAAPWPADT